MERIEIELIAIFIVLVVIAVSNVALVKIIKDEILPEEIQLLQEDEVKDATSDIATPKQKIKPIAFDDATLFRMEQAEIAKRHPKAWKSTDSV